MPHPAPCRGFSASVIRPVFGVALIAPRADETTPPRSPPGPCGRSAASCCLQHLPSAGSRRSAPASVTAMITPVSCCGQEPLRHHHMYSTTVPTSVPTAHQKRQTLDTATTPAASAGTAAPTPGTHARTTPSAGDGFGSCARSSRPHIIGVSVNDTTADTTNGRAQHHGELVEQPPDHPAHEQQRDEHRHQAHRQRHDGEPDLRRPLDTRPPAAARLPRYTAPRSRSSRSHRRPRTRSRPSAPSGSDCRGCSRSSAITPNVPINDSGSAMAGMIVARALRRNR